MINNSIKLQDWHPEKITEYKNLIEAGRPFVWQLALSFDAFNELEQAINDSIDAYCGSIRHLISREFALYVIIYTAEWYKRIYEGNDTVDKRKLRFGKLSSQEKELLLQYAEIDKETFIYKPVKNYMWEDSIQVLGGLAIKQELKRKDEDSFLRDLCRLYHGEEIDITEDNYQSACAFKKSIQEKHSLYHYIQAALKPKHDDPYPFDSKDIESPDSDVFRLIKKIDNADKYVQRDKYDLEWLIDFRHFNDSLVRQLRIGLKP